jgi:hypothetical protein
MADCLENGYAVLHNTEEVCCRPYPSPSNVYQTETPHKHLSSLSFDYRPVLSLSKGLMREEKCMKPTRLRSSMLGGEVRARVVFGDMAKPLIVQSV